MNTLLAINDDYSFATSDGGFYHYVRFDNSAGSDFSMIELAMAYSGKTILIRRIEWGKLAGSIEACLAIAMPSQLPAIYRQVFLHLDSLNAEWPVGGIYRLEPPYPIIIPATYSLYGFVSGEQNGWIGCDYRYE